MALWVAGTKDYKVPTTTAKAKRQITVLEPLMRNSRRARSIPTLLSGILNLKARTRQRKRPMPRQRQSWKGRRTGEPQPHTNEISTSGISTGARVIPRTRGATSTTTTATWLLSSGGPPPSPKRRNGGMTKRRGKRDLQGEEKLALRKERIFNNQLSNMNNYIDKECRQ
jgi:hypothetical protein